MEILNLLSRVRWATDEQLFAGVESLTLTEHACLAKVIVMLGEIDRRGIYREKAWPSLFEYCVAHLKYSEGQACRRIYAARAIHKFPELLPLFEERAITLTNLARVSRLLTPSNHLALAKEVGTNRKDEVERIIAKWFPRPDIKPMIRQLPAPLPPTSSVTTSLPLPAPLPTPPPPTPPPATVIPPPTTTTSGGKIKPLSPQRYGVQFTVDEGTFRQLEHAKQLTKHRGEAGSLENLMKRAIELLHQELEKERLGKTSRPQTQRRNRPMKDDGAIPRPTRREVFERDKEQCTFVDTMTNKRCAAKDHLEVDHIIPRSKGGKGVEQNLRLRCRTHNRLAAEEAFGRAFIDAKIRERQTLARKASGMRCTVGPAPSNASATWVNE